MAELFNILVSAVDARQNIVMTDVYQEVANVTLVGAELGDYEHMMSITSQYDQTTKSEFFRFSLDGGSTWEESQTEPKDKTDKRYISYPFVRTQVSGDLQLIIQARKEDVTGVMTVLFANAWIKRIG